MFVFSLLIDKFCNKLFHFINKNCSDNPKFRSILINNFHFGVKDRCKPLKDCLLTKYDKKIFFHKEIFFLIYEMKVLFSVPFLLVL